MKFYTVKLRNNTSIKTAKNDIFVKSLQNKYVF